MSNLPLLALEIDIIPLVSRVLHILSAVILVGGLFYIRTILSPAGVDACFADRRAVWAKWVGITTAFLLLTGIYNLILIIGEAKADGVKLPPTYHMLFGVKFLLGLIVMFIAAILAGKTEAADRFRGQMRKWLNIGWLAAVAIIVIAAVLRSLH
ncbi:MAG: hypothetical protein GXP24_01835 [Planctomycetes bacterium]|nr:hypothetical protein [Planctomycetota bacterium]